MPCVFASAVFCRMRWWCSPTLKILWQRSTLKDQQSSPGLQTTKFTVFRHHIPPLTTWLPLSFTCGLIHQVLLSYSLLFHAKKYMYAKLASSPLSSSGLFVHRKHCIKIQIAIKHQTIIRCNHRQCADDYRTICGPVGGAADLVKRRLDAISSRFVYFLWCPKGRFVHRTMEGGGAGGATTSAVLQLGSRRAEV